MIKSVLTQLMDGVTCRIKYRKGNGLYREREGISVTYLHITHIESFQFRNRIDLEFRLFCERCHHIIESEILPFIVFSMNVEQNKNKKNKERKKNI